jgi:sugar/nucleoside kinase (ribokinase family)
MPEVVCFGQLVADLVAYPVQKCPERGGLELTSEMRLSTGGGASNVTFDLQRLGVEATIVGRVGNDSLGDFVVQKLQAAGISVSGIKRDQDRSTSSCIVLTHPDGERSFIYSHGANAHLGAADLDRTLLDDCKIFHVGSALVLPGFDGEQAGVLLKEVQQRGCLTVVDTAWDNEGKWMQLIAPYLPYTDYFLPSFNEARELSQTEEPAGMAQYFLERGVRQVGIKLGSQGSYLANSEISFELPPYRVTSLDSTGAGDAFVAGFIAALLRGWDLKRSGDFANAVGALATTGLGATAGVRDLATTLSFMESAGHC